MLKTPSVKAAIVDYGMGNLFSVKHACEYTGMKANITSIPKEIMDADIVILPGVGAYGDAMRALKKLDLISPLREVVSAGIFLFGICLGMQLLMTESHEFGRHSGLGIIAGPVVRFENPAESLKTLKVPQVGWNRISNKNGLHEYNSSWANSPLEGLSNGEYMYFVHSYYPRPEDPAVILSVTSYGQVEFCSSLWYKNIFASQFHPERSGPKGLQIYKNIVSLVTRNNES